MKDLPQAAILPDGRRLHLHHGPIDLIVGAEGEGHDLALSRVTRRFQSVLTELVSELPGLQSRASGQSFDGLIARRMAAAVAPFAEDQFITPMAAVAGSVAEEMLGAMDGIPLDKAFVNNGGDIAFRLEPGRSFHVLGPLGEVEITADQSVRGVATSGWRGRSLSMGIADAVTVLARTASAADAAATMIANAVDLPGHVAISRQPASGIEAHPELGDRLVTVGVGPLDASDIVSALDRGEAFAVQCRSEGLIEGAILALQGATRVV